MPGSFVAASNQYINLGINQPYCVNCSGMTASAWIYVTDLSIEREIVAISVGAAAATSTSRISLMISTAGELQLNTRASDADAAHIITGTAGAIAVNTWYHILGACDFAAAAQAIFINGVLNASATGVTFNQTTTSNTNAYNSCIGSQDDGSANMMSGKIHDVRIFSRTFSLEEVYTIYTSDGRDNIIYKQDGRFLMSEGASGSTITSVPNLGTVRTAGTPVNSPTYANGVIEIQ